uniref:Uncharacterized protein n=1 Tax=Rhizophora mucronata TaxID=61149 RepID=A0A2P2Q6U1_RHIMU
MLAVAKQISHSAHQPISKDPRTQTQKQAHKQYERQNK